MEWFLLCACIAAGACHCLRPYIKYRKVQRQIWRQRKLSPVIFEKMAERDEWLRRKWEKELRKGRA